MRVVAAVLILLACLLCCRSARAQTELDSDHDGLSDVLESQLLTRFVPTFMISRTDCSAIPAEFVPELRPPTVAAEDGTIYGQAFPRAGHPGEVELHYYHLWRRDCGEMGHALDTEHVSALVALPEDDNAQSAQAIYWYAAAHEDTICDASQLTRASTLSSQDHGATVWISPGKHASFLSEVLCSHGCGGDHCADMKPLQVKQVVNLGELDHPMHDIAWLRAQQWPLADKMQRSDFTELRLDRLDRLPLTDVAWANPAKRPAQAAILGVNAGIGGAETGARSTDTALVIADNDTSSALDTASEKTGNALSTSTHHVLNALKKSARKTGDFLNPHP